MCNENYMTVWSNKKYPKLLSLLTPSLNCICHQSVLCIKLLHLYVYMLCLGILHIAPSKYSSLFQRNKCNSFSYQVYHVPYKTY